MVINKNILKFLGLLLFSSIIVVLNIWTIDLLFSNSGNVILNGNHQLYNIIVTAHGLLMGFFVVTFTFNGLGNFFLPIFIDFSDMVFLCVNNLSFWFLPFPLFLLLTSLFVYIIKMVYLLFNVNFAIFSFIKFLSKKFKFTFYPFILFFIMILLLDSNFSYTSGNDDFPLPSNGNPIGLIIFAFFIILGFIGAKQNLNSSSNSSSTNSLDTLEIEEINKVIINPIVKNETKNIPKVNLLDEMLINKLIGYGVLIFGFGVICFVIYKVLYPNYTKKYSKKYKIK